MKPAVAECGRPNGAVWFILEAEEKPKRFEEATIRPVLVNTHILLTTYHVQYGVNCWWHINEQGRCCPQMGFTV